jgi:hypothetical protein
MTGCNEGRIVACGPSHRSQYGELTDSHAITMHSSQTAMRVVALTVGFIPESYCPMASGGAPWGAQRFVLDRPRMTGNLEAIR